MAGQWNFSDPEGHDGRVTTGDNGWAQCRIELRADDEELVSIASHRLIELADDSNLAGNPYGMYQIHGVKLSNDFLRVHFHSPLRNAKFRSNHVGTLALRAPQENGLFAIRQHRVSIGGGKRLKEGWKEFAKYWKASPGFLLRVKDHKKYSFPVWVGGCTQEFILKIKLFDLLFVFRIMPTRQATHDLGAELGLLCPQALLFGLLVIFPLT